MRYANCFNMRLLLTGLVVAGAAAALASVPACASAGETAPSQAQEPDTSSKNPCAAYTQDETRSRAQALLDCQNKAASKVPPHLTSEEASKIYEAYIGKVSKDDDANK